MKVVVGLQARSNSSRLPGKVLLPIGGLPLSVLAAKRAAKNGKFDVRVLTSNEESDDQLCRVLESHKVPYYRGSLDDVLERFVQAFSDCSDDTIVVRLTADNPVPGEDLIDTVVKDFIDNQRHYLCVNGELSGLPYGASAEVTRLQYLREAHEVTHSSFDREHVTPFVRRKFGDLYFKGMSALNMGNLRCTVDNFDDYVRACGLFSMYADPVKPSSIELMKALKDTNTDIHTGTKRLSLGTAQLGLDYGINNTTGRPDKNAAHYLLSHAVHAGVQYIDTARAYGQSEKVIGQWLQQGWVGRATVITKLSPLVHLNETSLEGDIRASVIDSIKQSCIDLKLDTLDVLMLHRAEQVESFRGVVWQTLKEMMSEGIISELGVSVQSPKELEMVLRFDEITHIQLPFNILDSRWDYLTAKVLEQKARRKLIVHARSVLLQGLLVSTELELWKRANVTSPHAFWEWLDKSVRNYNCVSVDELCIRYVNSIPWIDTLVIGCETIEQLKSNMATINRAVFEANEIEGILSERPSNIEDKVINPALWS
ncbi:aldo/keto reductase [Vibrio breoganii]